MRKSEACHPPAVAGMPLRRWERLAPGNGRQHDATSALAWSRAGRREAAMRRFVMLCAAALTCAGGALADQAAMTMLAPGDLKWQDAPSALPPGARTAVLKGDPAKEGVFIIRIKAPDGYRIMPHWHPAYENVTVLSGKFGLGMGEAFDQSKGSTIGAGGFASMPPTMRHFAWVEGETEIQLTAYGPWQLYYVNPKDDPRNQAMAR
jgi:hypothetical protein